MSIRNELLKSIVIASGGTVTGNTRNELLQDWLDAVDPPVSYIARLDGLTQYWQLSEDITIQSNDDYTIKIGMLTDSLNFYILGSNSTASENRIALFEDSTSVIGGGFSWDLTTEIPIGLKSDLIISRIGGTLSMTFNGSTIASRESVSASYFFSRLGGKYEGSTSISSLSGYMSDFEFTRNGILENKIHLTNKSQGATQLPTVGGVSATMINYTEAVWQELL